MYRSPIFINFIFLTFFINCNAGHCVSSFLSDKIVYESPTATVSNGLIAQAGLEKWWNNSFTKKERNYIANSFRPNMTGFKNSDGILHSKIVHDPKNKVQTLVAGTNTILAPCQLLKAMQSHFSASDDEIRTLILRQIEKKLARMDC